MELKRAKEILELLADGTDPMTGELLPDDHVCNRPDVVRALHTVLRNVSEKKKRDLPANAGQPWTEEADNALRDMFLRGCTNREIQNYFQRTEGAISARLVKLGLIANRDEFRMKTNRTSMV
ncbi:MAG: hypothetical protein LUC47_00530 [Clostridiales bacterium]|nr:hypothetical protein [Clostridiales bacterium]